MGPKEVLPVKQLLEKIYALNNGKQKRMRSEKETEQKKREVIAKTESNMCSHSCLPKQAALLALEGMGKAYRDRGLSKKVLELDLMFPFQPLKPQEGFSDKVKEENVGYATNYDRHPHISLSTKVNKKYIIKT